MARIGNGASRRAPRKRMPTPAEAYMERIKPKPKRHRTPGDQSAATLRYLRSKAGREARKAARERATARRKSAKVRRQAKWARRAWGARRAAGLSLLDAVSGTNIVTAPQEPRKISPDLRKTQGMAKRGPAPLLTPELAGEILSHLEEGLSVAETARAVSQPDRRVRNWVSRGRLQTMASKLSRAGLIQFH